MAAEFATLLFGLVLAFPLVGHATWHAYADVFASTEPQGKKASKGTTRRQLQAR